MGMTDEIVSLNVGGTLFATSRHTLMKHPDSMLARMCNTEVPVVKDPSGAYFIDRDPTLFRLILNYLRSGFLSEKTRNCDLEELAVEADYYGLDELIKVIREICLPAPKPMKLSAELADIVGKKEATRAECIKQLWAYIKKHNLQDPENKQYFTPDKKMAKVFGNDKIRAFGMAKFLSSHLS